MLQNYIRVTLRSLRKNKGYAVINITGLAVGMACCLIIVLFVRDELSTDRFHTEADRIYRVSMHVQIGDTYIQTGTPLALASALTDEGISISDAILLSSPQRVIVEHSSTMFYESDFVFADSAFFGFFDFRLAHGNAETALNRPFSVVISQEMAEKYFAESNALGATLAINHRDYTVTGILAPIPAQSHLQFNFLASFSTQHVLAPAENSWAPSGSHTYARLAPGATPEAFQIDLDRIAQAHVSTFNADTRTFSIKRFTDLYFSGYFAGDRGLRGSIEYLYTFSAIAALILLIACINYMNLSTARARRYAKEVGVRKVVGAQRRQLIGRFLTESLLFSIVALLLAISLVELALPTFNAVTQKTLSVPYVNDVWLMALWLSVGLSTGFLSGSYPAFFLSKFKPIAVLKGSWDLDSRRSLLRKGLVIFQFTVTIIFFVGTLVVQAQLDHLQSKRLGFNKDQVIVLPSQPPVREHYTTFKAEIQQVPGVLGVASAPMPSSGYWSAIRLKGAPENASNYHRTYVIDGDFISMMDIEIVHGRALDPTLATDLEGSILINEAAMRAFGWTEDPLSHELERLGTDYTMVTSQVVGVVRDFNYRSLKDEVGPLILQLTNTRYENILVKVDPARIPETLKALQTSWSTFAPQHPFEYQFLDEHFASFYRTEERLGQIFRYFSFLTILIASLGLFGLATFMAEQRTKEIGVRKVFGASMSRLVIMLSQDFVKLVLIAFVLATPIAYILLTHWLSDFAYRIAISSSVFLFAGGAALLIAIITVSYQAIKASLTNPIDSLRYE